VGPPRQEAAVQGQEFAQEAEWSESRSLDWHLLENPEHAGIQSLVRDLNKAYRDEPALWEMDFDGRGFWWTEANAADDNVIAFARRTKDSERVVVFVGNFSPTPRHDYRIGLPRGGRWREAVNTDSDYYGGSGIGNMGGFEAEAIGWHGQYYSAEVSLPPLAALWLVPEADGPTTDADSA
jgi:1,4-alpha-glucan branching enzyme